MRLDELQPAKGSRRPRKRVGRGISAGGGKTAGRGQKGQGARTSWSLPRGFEGGQMPLTQRVPKLRGFYNRFRVEYQVVNCGKLGRFEPGTVVDLEALRAAGVVRHAVRPVKLLAGGGAPPKVTIRVHRASRAAVAAVEAAGGTVELLAGPESADQAESGPAEGGQVSEP
ncbi:MAG: 50S ribosomal protein L15 [Candidatus Dormibacteraeota bacterium]|nr:50S ribosomal protein L15 [Candidatus Dormibacteraeota bacterium]